MHTHPGSTSSVETAVADDQLHNILNFTHFVALRHTRQDHTLRRTAEQSTFQVVRKPKMVHHDGFKQRTSNQIIDLLSPQVAEGTVEVIAVGASRTHSVVQGKTPLLQRTVEQFLDAPVPQRIARRSISLSPVSWRVSTRMRLLVRSVIVQHPAWNTHVSCHRSCQQTCDKIVEGIDENVAHDRAQDKLFALHQQRPSC